MKRSRVPNPKVPEKREAKVLEIPPGTQDELSLIYFLRSKQFVLGETYFFPLLVKGKVLKARLTVEGREFVKNKKLGNVKNACVTNIRRWALLDYR